MRLGGFSFILVGMFSFIHFVISNPELNKKPTIEVKVLRVRAFQSTMKPTSQVEGSGGMVIGAVMGGNVTAYFPEGLVILETSSDSENKEIIELIKDEISSYPCSCGELIQIVPYAKKDIAFDQRIGLYDHFVLKHSITMRGIIIGEYRIRMQPIAIKRQTFMLNFEVDEEYSIFQALHDHKKSSVSERFNQAIELHEDNTVLVGYTPPRFVDSPRSSAYWFIISLKN